MGNFKLNVYKPMMAHNILESIELLRNACGPFTIHCLADLEAELDRIAENLSNNLMLVTALTPHIDYDKAAEIAKTSLATGKTLKRGLYRPDQSYPGGF